MGYEELVRHLIRSAEVRKEEILGRARGEAARLRASALERAGEMDREARDAMERNLARERRVRWNRARLALRAVRLKARAALAAEIVARLEERLSLLPGSAGYARVAARLYGEIRPEVPEGNVVLRGDEAALAVLKSLAPEPRFRFETLPDGELGGVEASCAGGGLRLRNTFRSRLAKAMPEVLAEIGRSLEARDE